MIIVNIMNMRVDYVEGENNMITKKDWELADINLQNKRELQESVREYYNNVNVTFRENGYPLFVIMFMAEYTFNLFYFMFSDEELKEIETRLNELGRSSGYTVNIHTRDVRS